MKYVLITVGGDGATFTTETPICTFSDKTLAQQVVVNLTHMRGKKGSQVSKDLGFSLVEVRDITDGAGSDALHIAQTLAKQGLCQ